MAKRNKKSKNGAKRNKRIPRNALLGTFAGGVLGKVVERLIVNRIEHFITFDHKHKKKDQSNGPGDVAAMLLTALADGGPKAVPQLLADTGVGLSPVLRALQTLRDFRLINLVGEPGEETVEVTRSGSHAVTAIRSNHIRREAAAHLLEC